MLPELIEQYAGMYVLFEDGNVIDADIADPIGPNIGCDEIDGIVVDGQGEGALSRSVVVNARA